MSILTGKVALVTGASRGLGRAIALEFARRGANLIINSRPSSGEALQQTRRECESSGVKVLAVSADVSQRRDVERLAAEALARFGRVDVLINNASALGPTPMPYLSDYPVEQFERVMRTNVVAPFLLTRAIVGQMISHGDGSIINVSSDAGVVGYATWGAYGVSKAALDQLMRTWAAELDGTGVRMNSVDPGSMDTEMHRRAEPGEDPAQWARPEQLTQVFVYLASNEGRQVNGQRLDAQAFAADHRTQR